MKQPSLSLKENADTLASRAAAAVEADILRGALAPGARLGVAATAQRYGVGATPLREGLSRLAARGLVDAVGHRGFRVRAISCDDLADIVRVRRVLEREAMALSVAAGDGAWEGEVVAALHRLKRHVEENAAGFGEGEPTFDALHRDFHAALIAACGSPRLIGLCARLYDEAYRYRRIMMSRLPSRADFVVSHERLAEAALARRAQSAAALAEAHIAATLALVYPQGGAG